MLARDIRHRLCIPQYPLQTQTSAQDKLPVAVIPGMGGLRNDAETDDGPRSVPE